MKQKKKSSYATQAYKLAGVSKATFYRALRKRKEGKTLTPSEAGVLIGYYRLIDADNQKLAQACSHEANP